MGNSIHPARFTIFPAWLLAELIILPVVAVLAFNSFQRLSAFERVEMSFFATFWIFLHGRSRGEVRIAPLSLTPRDKREINGQIKNVEGLRTRLAHVVNLAPAFGA